MVALAHPPTRRKQARRPDAARQLKLPLPQPDSAAVRRLESYLARMLYGDALLCGAYALERQALERSYVEWLLYYRDRLIGVAERSRSNKSYQQAAVRNRLAPLLLREHGWDVQGLKLIRCGAITSLDATVARVPRLIKKGE